MLVLALAALLVCSLATLCSGQEGWIVAGLNQRPTCSLCVNALGAPNRQDRSWSGVRVGVFRCVKSGANELWVVDDVHKTIHLTGYGDETLCLDAGSQPDYNGRNVTFLPLHIVPCDGSARQQWFYNSSSYSLRSGLNDADGSALYLVQGELATLTNAVPNTTATYHNLYLSTEAAFASTPGLFNSNFTFNRASDYTPLSARISDGDPPSGNLVRNGGFERATVLDRWPAWQDCRANGSCAKVILYPGDLFSLCSWQIGPTPPDWVNHLEPNWTAAQGNSSLLLSWGASVYQTIPTRPNAQYVLTFSLAGLLSRNTSRSGSYPLCSDPVASVSITVDNFSEELFALSDNETSRVGEDTHWVHRSMRFVAAGDTTLLQVSSSGVASSCGPVIDDVRVLPYEPVPPHGSRGSKRRILLAIPLASSSLATAALVLLVGGLLCRRRQQKSGQISSAHTPAAHSVKSFTYTQIQAATSNWSTIVGKGGFSTVYRAQFPDGVTGAVKVEHNKDILQNSLFQEELAVLLRVNHRYLVNLMGFCAQKDHPILVFEYLPNGSLYQRLHTDKPAGMGILPWQARMKIIYQVSCALEYLHHGTSLPIVHRDIKSANILLTATDSAKLADFGLSKCAPAGASAFHTVATDVKGSLGYLDPKYLRSGVYSIKSDVYSYGVLLLEIVSGHTAIKDLDLLTDWAAEYINDPLLTHAIVDSRVCEGSWSCTDLNVLVDVVKMCLQHDPHQRPTMEQVVSCLLDSGFSGCPPSNPSPVVHHAIAGSHTASHPASFSSSVYTPDPHNNGTACY